MYFLNKALWAAPVLVGAASAASFPPVPTGLTTVNSTKFPGVSISYKATTICETTPGVQSYSGYVHLPPSPAEHRLYNAHMYFWFFRARKDPSTAPLTVWLQGGPGVPSITAAVGENGPCSILPDSKTTELNPWSWNDRVNMLYIDQPVQTGFSYDSLVNGTLNEIPLPFQYKPNNFSTGIPETNLTFHTGTFASSNPNNAPNTTIAASKIMYHFMQAWMQDFPEYKTKDNKFSIWGESYDGHYGPAFAEYFETRAEAIEKNITATNITGISTEDIPLHLDTVGFINPCIDIDTQMPFYPEFAFNNTYDIQLISEANYAYAISSAPKCKEMSTICKTLADAKDPEGLGNVAEVNKACFSAYDFCFSSMHQNYTLHPTPAKARNNFDIAAPAAPESFPPKWAAGYLNQAHIQQALGVPLNFTGASALNMAAFNNTGDFVRGHQLRDLGTLLDRGVKVALVFGDRDYQCNWLGGEALSLAIESKFSAGFKTAEYADIVTNKTYVGGLVRQYANLSFSRVFRAGHEVPFYQPETAYEIFNRAMFGKDVATGGLDVCEEYRTVGLGDAWLRGELDGEREVVKCYLWDVFETCTVEEIGVLVGGDYETEDFVLMGKKKV
ncbi:alpha/beta-hydrolase [Massarina eburnea CBS 473.64]|uniref:Alpha/beta-hydrolase n=1 Tax=Massarina eburnea CBS 473.64 TaxID=1395130 RepID=A0A6A6RRQ2_9PLEO|nr:alpha/beta-hydrolase [Massarina eburnea CBS 473.64]